MIRILLVVCALSVMTESRASAAEPQPFVFKIQRSKKTENGLIVGTLYVNDKEIGPVYEHPEKKIAASPAGTPYGGALRQKSDHNFVQNPGGQLGMKGDFLLEITGVKGRTNILFHPGNKPEHTEGCILCGPAMRDKAGIPFAPETLKKLRLAFYDGKDNPTATPNKKIEVIVLDP
jgi:hypothetical protein